MRSLDEISPAKRAGLAALERQAAAGAKIKVENRTCVSIRREDQCLKGSKRCRKHLLITLRRRLKRLVAFR